MAFVQVAAGVFQMSAHQVIAPLANGGGGEGMASSESGDRGKRSEFTGRGVRFFMSAFVSPAL